MIKYFFTLLLAIFFPSVVLAQDAYVIDTAFCKQIVNNACIQPMPAGQTYKISNLRTDAEGPILHFWGKVRNPSDRAIAIIFTRKGECYEEGKTLPEEKVKNRPTTFGTIGAFFSSISIADVLGRIGVKDASLGGSAYGVDAKVNFLSIPRSDGFRVNDARNVPCPGEFRAVLVDSKSDQLPPETNNDFKTITFVK
jgi:hypothetical protein